MRNFRILTCAIAIVFCAAVSLSAEEAQDAHYTEDQVRELMDPACNALGIDPDACHCITAEVIAAHGTDAAAYVALGIWTRDEEAEALKSQLGEDKAMAASDLFDVAQNRQCANRPAPAEGGAAAAGESAMDAVGSPQ